MDPAALPHYKVFDKAGAQIVNFPVDHPKPGLDFNKRLVDTHGGWIEDETGKIVHGKKPIGKVDFTPTWRSLIPMFRAVIEDGTDEGRRIAWEEMTRMAEAADAYNAGCKS